MWYNYKGKRKVQNSSLEFLGKRKQKKGREKLKMKSVMEMKKWDFTQAWRFFNTHAKRKVIPETQAYMSSATQGGVYDCRKGKVNLNIWDHWMATPTLFLIDGASASGKTTLAKKLAARYDIKVVDCDILCIEWMEKKLKNMSPLKRSTFLMNIDRLTDEYLESNMEAEVLKASEHGKKSVILVGAFIEPLYRTIIGETIGSHFINVIGIIMHESNLNDVLENEKARNRKMNFKDDPNLTMKTAQQYQYIESLIAEGTGWILGIGTTMTYVVKKGIITD